jgi:hypothetical protein
MAHWGCNRLPGFTPTQFKLHDSRILIIDHGVAAEPPGHRTLAQPARFPPKLYFRDDPNPLEARDGRRALRLVGGHVAAVGALEEVVAHLRDALHVESEGEGALQRQGRRIDQTTYSYV